MGDKINLKVNKANPVTTTFGAKANPVTATFGAKGSTRDDYGRLANKPKINGVELEGNKIDYELYLQHKMQEITEQDIDNIIFGV